MSDPHEEVRSASLPSAGPGATPDASGAVLLPDEEAAPAAAAVGGGDGNEGEPADLWEVASAEAELARQRDEYLEALQRLQAEFDNYRKRVERQQRDIVESAASGLVKKLLPVLDTADLALAHGGGEDIKQVAGTLFDVLAKEGLDRILPEGQAFDPELHDAVAHDAVDGEDAPSCPEVSEVLRAGYRWKGRVLRPAMVKVRG